MVPRAERGRVALAERVAALFGKEAGIFTPTGSLANQLAIRNVSLEVSSALLEFGKRQRMTHAASVFLDVVSSKNDPVLLDKTEIIFEHSLALDPIRLLSQLARNVTVVATWSGTYRDGKLTYASPSHPEFRSIDEVDAVIINMDGS